MSDSSTFPSSKSESETDVVSVSDNVVHDDRFSNPAFSLPTPPPPSFQLNNNNIYKSGIPKQDPAKVR
jgi:hypothetical protein